MKNEKIKLKNPLTPFIKGQISHVPPLLKVKSPLCPPLLKVKSPLCPPLLKGVRGILLCILHFAFCIGNSYGMDPWPDTVYSWIEGDGAGFGKGHFPDNVLGPPDSNARPCIPSARPDEILTLGTGGVIILGFTDNRIIDGIGPDFVVFENSFYVLCDSENVFAETGIISVSQDCVNFVQFSYNASTWEGLAGVTPTTGEDYMNPDSSGGDAFDLANVGLPWAICVRIQDADTLVDDSGPHFDLDAVVAVHSAPPLGIEENHNQSNPLNQLIRLEQNFPNPFRFETVIHYSIPQGGKFVIYNLMGQKVYSMSLSPESHVLRYRGGDLPGGSYLYEIQSKDTRVARKMLIVR